MKERSYLKTEPLADVLARGDCTVRCAMTAGPRESFFDTSGFLLDDGNVQVCATAVRQEGNDIIVTFPRAIKQGDSFWL